MMKPDSIGTDFGYIFTIDGIMVHSVDTLPILMAEGTEFYFNDMKFVITGHMSSDGAKDYLDEIDDDIKIWCECIEVGGYDNEIMSICRNIKIDSLFYELSKK